MNQLAVLERTQVAGVQFANELEVNQHYDLAERKVVGEIQTSMQTALSSHKAKVLGIGLAGAGAITLLGMFLWTVVLPAVAVLGIAAVFGMAGIFMYFRLPSWIGSLRLKADIAREELKMRRIEALRQQRLDHINRFKAQAEADPIANREHYAQVTAEEITAARTNAAQVAGLIEVQQGYVVQMKRDYPEADTASDEAMIAVLRDAHGVMVAKTNDAHAKLEIYKRKTGLLELKLKSLKGSRTLSEFLRDEGATRQFEKLMSDTATQAADVSIQTALADLRVSVQVAKDKLPTK